MYYFIYFILSKSIILIQFSNGINCIGYFTLFDSFYFIFLYLYFKQF